MALLSINKLVLIALDKRALCSQIRELHFLAMQGLDLATCAPVQFTCRVTGLAIHGGAWQPCAWLPATQLPAVCCQRHPLRPSASAALHHLPLALRTAGACPPLEGCLLEGRGGQGLEGTPVPLKLLTRLVCAQGAGKGTHDFHCVSAKTD